LDPVRRPASCCGDQLGSLAEILGTDRGWSDGTERLRVVAAVVVEPMNGAARNAEGLARTNVHAVSVDGPGQHALDPVNGLFVVIVAVRRSRQTLRRGNRELEDGDTAARVVSCDQEAHGEWPETNGLVGGIDANVGHLRRHGGRLLW